jgi:hypothetical protein
MPAAWARSTFNMSWTVLAGEVALRCRPAAEGIGCSTPALVTPSTSVMRW